MIDGKLSQEYVDLFFFFRATHVINPQFKSLRFEVIVLWVYFRAGPSGHVV